MDPNSYFKQRDEMEKAYEELQDIKDRQAKEKETRKSLRKIYLEILKKEDPDNIYIPFNTIKKYLLAFFTADTDYDDDVSLKELEDLAQPSTKEDVQDLRDFFKYTDLSGDGKLDVAELFIMGLIHGSREEQYKNAKKID
ncbi:hypothetical protein BDV28DRAFT_4952 [Aspergillus coremiiformis]|uniref:EF-hand domain-containing protein n=1 Tax=Aspergillus coremiiformis TaxID=138285 RepID=A0A5N6Z3L6_9EURO|nr:hypothetical protein BDV28DRAFT_4952 [Aspergillus coremiiformis]